ncbi:hypothetical protein RclHR1_03700015 [Rhizophagus clarus]|uniref:Uncharacterized protein n=1 Tax=Rhizophagus clarus TaxID=94130 RepID=A0A2Z6RC03_9GLOM|nr:hypothetical protein RclHR1_03700015 [Rhizophagus clarus]GES72655.1 hypothetical protein GLOIN_2v1485334 [Rhizophagus clarus]
MIGAGGLDGVNLKEHQQRFQSNGRYVPILEVAEEWAVVDIRNSKMELPDQYGKDDIYALCGENFESIHLIYPDRTEQVVKLLGEECIENLLEIGISEFLKCPITKFEIIIP